MSQVIVSVVTLLLGVTLLAFNVITQSYYVERSRSILSEGSGFAEASGASEAGLLDQMREKIASVATHVRAFIPDTNNIVLGKMEGGYSSPAILTFLTDDPYYNISGFSELNKNLISLGLRPDVVHAAFADADARNNEFLTLDFPHKKFVDFNRGPLSTNVEPPNDDVLRFEVDRRASLAADSATDLIRTGTTLSPFNHWIAGRPDGANIDVEPLKDQHNYLHYIPSNLGESSYYANDPTRVSFYQPEADLYARGSEMTAYGRFALFDVINPTPTVRIVIDVSQTLRDDGMSRLPRFDIVGSDHVILAPEGSGAMRLISPPLRPYTFRGHHLVAIESDATPYLFNLKRSGLMSLYGRSLPLDPRRLVGFARDFSAVSPAAVARLQPPREIRNFPDDLLKNRFLEYSGLYEDGWASKVVFVRLSRPQGTTLRIRGAVPLVDDHDFKQRLIVRVGSSVVADRALDLGEFDIDVPVKDTCTVCDVTLAFGRIQHLPGPNPRPVSALLNSIAF